RLCNPESASSPPESSMTIAMPSMHRPQNTTMLFFGAGLPRDVIMPMTTDAESAAVMKKIASTPIRMNGMMPLNGSVSNRLNSTASGEASPSNPSTPLIELMMDAPPKTVNARIRIRVGIPMVTSANSLSVRPREIRAMKVPTNGVQAIHQAQ